MKTTDLKIKQVNNKYVVELGGDLLKTPGGFLIESTKPDLMERIIIDFKDQGDLIVKDGIIIKPRALSAYLLASTKRDFIDEGDDLSQNLPGWLSIDPIFKPTAGHPIVSMYQKEAQSKAEKFFNEYGLVINEWHLYSNQDKVKIISLIKAVIEEFTPCQKSALVNLSWPCGSQFVNSTVYLLGKYDEREWATAIFSRTLDVCRIVGEVPVDAFISFKDDLTDEERQSIIESLIKGYMEDCLLVKKYIEATNSDQ